MWRAWRWRPDRSRDCPLTVFARGFACLLSWFSCAGFDAVKNGASFEVLGRKIELRVARFGAFDGAVFEI